MSAIPAIQFRDVHSVLEACGAPAVTEEDRLRHDLLWARNRADQLQDRTRKLEAENNRLRGSSGQTEQTLLRLVPGQRVVIDGLERVTVKVLAIDEGDLLAVRLEVEAPEETPVMTGEAFQRTHP